MSRDWESVFQSWAGPSSETEAAKCENAERMIKGAIRDSEALAKRDVRVFAQGSYRNNTNVRQESDVDICVCDMSMFFSDFTTAKSFDRDDVGLTDSSYTYAQFKKEVEAALVAKFGRSAVTRGDKAFDIHENSYRVDADVVAACEHRRYTTQASDGTYNYISGIEFRPDSGGKIRNWPQQHYDNGVRKNDATSRRYKKVVRILKRLRNEMADGGVQAAKPIPSFLIECLVWNTPNEGFGHTTLKADVRYALAHTFNETRNDERCHEWGEVSELKYLFRNSQPWTREEAHAFLAAAWDYVGFE
jgi:hypothetical protein